MPKPNVYQCRLPMKLTNPHLALTASVLFSLIKIVNTILPPIKNVGCSFQVISIIKSLSPYPMYTKCERNQYRSMREYHNSVL